MMTNETSIVVVAAVLGSAVTFHFITDTIHPGDFNAPEPPRAAFTVSALSSSANSTHIIMSPITEEEYRADPPMDHCYPAASASSG